MTPAPDMLLRKPVLGATIAAALGTSLWVGAATVGLASQGTPGSVPNPPPRPPLALAAVDAPNTERAPGTGHRAQERPASSLQAEASAPEVSIVRDAIAAYRNGDVGTGDRIRARVDSGLAPLLDWAAVRFGGPAVDLDRVSEFLRRHPDWPGAAWVRNRAETLLLSERRPADSVRAFFSRERPQSPGGKVALAKVFVADGLKDDAATLVRDAWRNDDFGRELEARILNDFP
jgi:hypothetical protein